MFRAVDFEENVGVGHETRKFGVCEMALRVIQPVDLKCLSIDTVAEHGDLPLLKYLHQISAVKSCGRHAKKAKTTSKFRLVCTTKAMDQAAACNHLDVVQWLHANQNEGCTTRAMDLAARNGHVNVVKWLNRYRLEGCTEKAMDDAASNGHLEVVKWLDGHRSEGCTTAAMDRAASGGHLEVVKWLHKHTSAACTTKAMDRAAINGHLKIVKWLHNNREEGCSTAAMDGATHATASSKLSNGSKAIARKDAQLKPWITR